MKGLILIFVIALAASPIFISCGNKHAEKPAAQADTTHIQPAPVHADTVAPGVLTAVFLDSVYHADPKKASKEYKGKTITLMGEIKAVHKNKSPKHKGLNWITLLTGSKEATSHLMCTSPDPHFVGELKKGQQVTVKGICIGTVGHNVHLKESEIVQ